MIITLCGSAKFEKHWHLWNKALTLAGHSVFSLGSFPSHNLNNKNWYSESEKITLDLVHLNKIANSDAIVVLNVDGYLGESTLKELEFAKISNIKIFMLESWGLGINGSPRDTSKYRTCYDLLGPSGELRSKLVEEIHNELKSYEVIRG